MLKNKNYKINKTIKLTEGVINGQGLKPQSDMRYGFFSMGYNGCEMIATYNLLLLNGYKGHSLCEICRYMYPRAWAFWGIFGSNVYVLDKYFKGHGVLVKKFLNRERFFDELNKNGLGMVSFWNDNNPFKGIHTVCVQKTDTGYRIYNRYNSKDYPYDYKNDLEVVDKRRYMCGYVIKSNKK